MGEALATADLAHSTSDVAGKFMHFRLASETYGIAILQVREIIRMMEITRVPRTRPAVRGVINLRGKVIPVVDLRLSFGLPPTEPTDQTVIIVVQVEEGDRLWTVGLLVDEVLEVARLEADQIEPPPAFGLDAVADSDLLVGVAKHGGSVVFLLDAARVIVGDTDTGAA